MLNEKTNPPKCVKMQREELNPLKSVRKCKERN